MKVLSVWASLVTLVPAEQGSCVDAWCQQVAAVQVPFECWRVSCMRLAQPSVVQELRKSGFLEHCLTVETDIADSIVLKRAWFLKLLLHCRDSVLLKSRLLMLRGRWEQGGGCISVGLFHSVSFRCSYRLRVGGCSTLIVGSSDVCSAVTWIHISYESTVDQAG